MGREALLQGLKMRGNVVARSVAKARGRGVCVAGVAACLIVYCVVLGWHAGHERYWRYGGYGAYKGYVGAREGMSEGLVEGLRVVVVGGDGEAFERTRGSVEGASVGRWGAVAVERAGVGDGVFGGVIGGVVEGGRVLVVEAGTIVAQGALVWLWEARRMLGGRVDVAGFALDGARVRVKGPGGWQILEGGEGPFLYRLCIGGTAFMPNWGPDLDVWGVFREWLALRRGDWYKYPGGLGVDDTPLSMGTAPERNWTRAAWNVWFSKFINEYELSVLYPNLLKTQVLAMHPEHDRSRDVRLAPDEFRSFYPHSSADAFKVTEEPPQYDATGRLVAEAKFKRENVDLIAKRGLEQGGVVSFTMVNKIFLDTAHSWLCNVDVAGFRPKGLVWAVTDEETRAVTLAIDGTHTVLLDEVQGGKETGHEFGNPGYWRLMLERTTLIGEILNRGIAVFAFETDAIWLEDPAPYIQQLVNENADIVGTINTRMEVSGNFFYLRPTLATRKLWNEITRQFEAAYKSARFEKKLASSWTYIQNDQSLLTNLVLRNETWRRNYPLSFLTLDMERFTDGRWYTPEKGFYTSDRARKPVMINNNFVIGVAEKTARAKKWGHWFWDERNRQCLDDVVRKAVVSTPTKRDFSATIGHDGTYLRKESVGSKSD